MIREEKLHPLNQSSQEDKLSHTITRRDDDWRFVEFHLKSSLTCDVEIKRIISVKNPHIQTVFDKKAKNKLQTYAWFSFKGTSDDKNSLSKLRAKGFDVPINGIEFKVGSLYDDTNTDTTYETESVYVLCKINIGRSYCKIVRDPMEFSAYGMENAFRFTTKPAAYDTIMFCPADSLLSRSTKTGWGLTKAFRYRIFDSGHILPLYCVSFAQIETTISNLYTKFMCAECEVREADYYCTNCEEYLCSDCYQAVHDSSTDKTIKKLFDHKKEEIKSKLKTGKCNDHPDKDVEYYCEVCKKPICAYCKVVGDHGKGESVHHTITEINVAYSKLSPSDSSEVIKSSEEKKKKAIDVLTKVKGHIEQLRTTILEKANIEIQHEFEEESQHIKAKSTENLIFHLSLINELQAIRDTAVWLDRYFTDRWTFLKEHSNKCEFVFVWNYHHKMLEEIIDNKKYVQVDYHFDVKEFDSIKINELKILHYRFEEASNFKEQNKEDNIKKTRDLQKKGAYDKFQKSKNSELVGLTKKILNLNKIRNSSLMNSRDGGNESGTNDDNLMMSGNLLSSKMLNRKLQEDNVEI